MIRWSTVLTIMILSLVLLACRQGQSTSLSLDPTAVDAVVTNTSSSPAQEIRPMPEVTNSPAPSSTPTARATPTPKATSTPTPTPTSTPISTERLAIATRAFHNGEFARAQANFEALLVDPGADPDEQRLALYWRGRSELALEQYNTANTSFGLFLETYPDNELARPAQFNQALALEHMGLYTDTIAAYQASLLPDDPIAAYIYERMGDVALTSERFEDAAKWYLTGLNHTTDTGFQVHLREGLAEAYLGQKEFERTIAQYNGILEVAEIPAYRAKIMRLIGEAYLEAEDKDAAQEQFQRVLDRYPETYDAYLTLVKMVEVGMEVDEFQRGYVDYYGGGVYQPAVEAMQRFLNTDPKSNADEALWIAAWSWRILGDFDSAIAAFDQIITTHPNSRIWAEAHLQKARTLGWQGKITEAVELYRNFAAEHPNDPLSQEALYKAALLEFQDDRFSDAYQNFPLLIEQYPYSRYADEARYWGGLAAYLDGNYAGAEQEWVALLNHYPASEFARAASYWQARTLLDMGQQTEAETLLEQLSNQPFNYYSLRARDLLHNQHLAPSTALNLTSPSLTEQIEAEAWLANWLGLSQNANFADLDRHIQGDPAFVRGEALLSLGLAEDALDEYEQVKNNWLHNPLAMYQLALAFKERGAYRLSILCAQELVRLSPATNPASVPQFIRRLIYPTYYRDLILAQTETLDLDPALVFALIRQESLYDPAATSFADARGLMQIIPSTGVDIATRTNAPNYNDSDLWLPYLNIEFGVWYLKQMLNFFDGNQFAALAAYNAGPGRVQTWLEETEDLDVFVARIPLDEPEEYIRRIYLNLAAYREIYKSGDSLPGQ